MRNIRPGYSLTECMLDYDSRQISWFTLSFYEPLMEMVTFQSLIAYHDAKQTWTKAFNQH